MYVLWRLLKITVIGIEMRWIGISDSRSSTTNSLLSRPLHSVLYDPCDVVQVHDVGLVCLAGRMFRELFLSFPSILRPYLRRFWLVLVIVGGDFWLIIGTFLSHYRDNLPDKRNREFANAPCHTSIALWPNYCCWPNYRGMGVGVAIIDPAIAIRRVMLAPIFQCHLEQLKLIRMPGAQGSSLQNMWVFLSPISSDE